MSVYFCNESSLDLDFIRIMGASVKGEGSIGYFGTGLKFAISTLLRFNQSIQVRIDGVVHTLDSVPKTIRGEDFEIVRLDGEELGYMTNLGRDWEIWNAYRELHSNCLDEGGVISDSIPPGKWGTVIKASGDLICNAYRDRSSIFIESAPIAVTADTSIHRGSSAVGFYRGVRAYGMPRPSIHTYNVTANMDLTEDRTIKEGFMYHARIAWALLDCRDASVIEKALLCDDAYLESQLDVDYEEHVASEEFLKVCEMYHSSPNLNKTARNYWERKNREKVVDTESSLDSLNESDLAEAIEMIRLLDCLIQREDFTVVDNLGGSVYGCVKGGRIFIDKKTFDKGPRFIASTLYEEWVHKNLGHKDETRAFQDFLLDKLLFFVDKAHRSGVGES